MSSKSLSEELMVKADRAILSARLLLDAGDVDGACNRAYYAMFDAARAALFAAKVMESSYIGKTHSGLITAFSLHFVKNGLVSNELGRALNRAEEIRLTADYKGDSVETDDAREMIEQAVIFVDAMRSAFFALEGMSED